MAAGSTTVFRISWATMATLFLNSALLPESWSGNRWSDASFFTVRLPGGNSTSYVFHSDLTSGAWTGYLTVKREGSSPTTAADDWLLLQDANFYDLSSSHGCLSDLAASTPSCAALTTITSAAVNCRIFICLAVASLIWPVLQVMDLQGTRTWHGEVGGKEELESYSPAFSVSSLLGLFFLGATLVVWPVVLNNALALMMKEFKEARAITLSTDTVGVRPGGGYWLTLMSTLMAIAVLNGSCVPWRSCPSLSPCTPRRLPQRTSGEATPLIG